MSALAPWTEELLSRIEIDDDTADELAWCELIQRRLWALDLQLDPETADLLELPPVAPRVARAA